MGLRNGAIVSVLSLTTAGLDAQSPLRDTMETETSVYKRPRETATRGPREVKRLYHGESESVVSHTTCHVRTHQDVPQLYKQCIPRKQSITAACFSRQRHNVLYSVRVPTGFRGFENISLTSNSLATVDQADCPRPPPGPDKPVR